jgi:peptide/nickel transport system substrate-binding protein/oligopeptide transport system substrate-binding protein
MKKTLALLLAALMLFGVLSACSNSGVAKDEVAKVDWTGYDALIAEIKTTTDMAHRVDLMHQAEDMLMSTYCINPIWYYNDSFLLKDYVTGIYSNNYGYKYFMYANMGNGSKTLKLNLASEPDKLDPALNSSVDGACLAINSFGGLFRYNEAQEIVGNFAEGYTVSEDGLTYTFTLKKGLKWSDGSPLTANDFVYSWNRAVDEKTAADYAYMFDGLAGWEATNDTTLVVTLKAPCAYMLDLMSFPTFYPVKQSEVESYDDWETNPGHWAQEAGFVSCGAYVLKEWKHDESMVYEKNPYFWDAANVKVERLEFMLSADDTAIFAAYQAGDIDFADTVPTDEIASLLGNPEFHVVGQLGTYYMCFNIKSKLFAGKTAEQATAMRQAFCMLLDRDYVAKNVGQTGQVPANAFIPIGMADGNGGIFKTEASATVGYFDPYAINNDYEGTLNKARELLKSAGYKFDKNGVLSSKTPISFEYLTNESSGHIAVAEAMQSDLAVLGITMTIKSEDWSIFLDDRKQGNYDVARNGWIADFNDPINMLEMWTTDSGNNDVQFGR